MCIRDRYRTRFIREYDPLISIIIPNKDHIDDLKRCMDAIDEKSTYRNYEYIIVDYGVMTGAAVCDCARCDQKIIVGSLSEWRAGAFLEAAGLYTCLLYTSMRW